MSKKYLILLILWFPLALHAQFIKPTDVPDHIRATLISQFPEGKVAVWKTSSSESDIITSYEASFLKQSKRCWVNIDLQDKIIKYEKIIEIDSMPQVIREMIHTNYSNMNMVEARIIQSLNSFYFVGVLENHEGIRLVFIKPDGSISKEIKESSYAGLRKAISFSLSFFLVNFVY